MNIRGLLIDLDGVMYTGREAIPGAAEALRYLDRNGIGYRFLSNSTRRSRRSIAAFLSTLGLEIPAGQIFTPPAAAVSYMRNAGRTRCHLLTTPDAGEEFCAPGITIAGNGVDYVVVGDADTEFTYDRMTRAFRLVNDGAGILALEKDRYWMGADGLMLSAGPFVAALEYATGKQAELVGKPSPRFFGLALEDMGLTPPEAAMIGDDIFSDIGGARSCGIAGILVRTGKFRPELLADPAAPGPAGIIGSIGDLPAFLARPPGTFRM